MRLEVSPAPCASNREPNVSEDTSSVSSEGNVSHASEDETYALDFQRVLENLRRGEKGVLSLQDVVWDEEEVEPDPPPPPLKPPPKARELKPVNHEKIKYRPLQKNVYVPDLEGRTFSQEEIDQMLQELDHTRIKGQNPPVPLATWSDCGLGSKTIELLGMKGCEQPFSVQRAVIPCLLRGRDVLCVAPTGSGKTFAYVLPMLRHIENQPGLLPREGPLAFILVCTRELARQVGEVMTPFFDALTLRVGMMHGGSNVGQDISTVRSGCHAIVGTPGRITDLLIANRGKVLSLSRVGFVVLDETDRLFDEGFGLQVKKILVNIRPDRQTAMFSATMPVFIQKDLKKILRDPLCIFVGSRVAVAQNVIQKVEIFPHETERFLRLLEVLGVHTNAGHRVLIFMEKKALVEELNQKLVEYGYRCACLFSTMDPIDRKCALEDFSTPGTPFSKAVMISTGVAARGLDVLNLDLVLNYSPPPSIEEYIHRVGRTGRAGKKGHALTFLRKDIEARHTVYLSQALKSNGSDVEDELERLAAEEYSKTHPDLKSVVPWKPTDSHTSYGGHGFVFDEQERRETKRRKRAQQHQLLSSLGLHSEASTSASEEEKEDENRSVTREEERAQLLQETVTRTGREIALTTGDAKSRALAFIDALNTIQAQHVERENQGIFSSQITINDLNPRARRWATQRQNFIEFEACTATTISVRGHYLPPGPRPQKILGESLHLRIEGSTREQVESAVQRLNALLREQA